MASVGEAVLKYPRTSHLPFSPGMSQDDVVLDPKLCTSLPFLDREAVLTEKLDGGNCSIYRGKVYSRSTNSEATHPSFGPIKQLAAEFSYFIPQNLQLFGENMFGVHSLEYDGLESYIYLFAGIEDGSKWMAWDHVTELANEISVPTVPVLTTKQFDNLQQVEEEIVRGMKRTSQCVSCHPEGFVIRTVDGFTSTEFCRHVAKYVRSGHIQTDDTWRRTWKPAKLRKT